MRSSGQIDRVVVLMLENRSFDCMLGRLYPKSDGFNGLSSHESNPYHKPDGSVEPIFVWNDEGMEPATATIPDPDPGELFENMNVQIFGKGGRANADPPPMNGFVDDYMQQPAAIGAPLPDPRAVMHHFTPKQVPVMSRLATAFGVSDQWHAPAPCQTWPNRFFVHTGTAGGYVNNNPTHFPYLMPSIFRRLEDHNRSWKIYFHDLPQASTLADAWISGGHFRKFGEFLSDAASGDLPNYSFIEPRYFSSRLLQLIPNDQHPPHNVIYGEQLLAQVYNALRSAPTWKKTLFVVTYDEHGGCFDHAPPPLAVPPAMGDTADGFPFDRYGVRVPALIISPFIAPGSVVRSAPAGLPHRGSPYPFDHTSIIATLRKLFDLGAPLTDRDAAAPDLIGPLSLDQPENDGLDSIGTVEHRPSPAEVEHSVSAPPNHMQQGLCSLAAHLPAEGAALTAHAGELARGKIPAVPQIGTVHDATNFIQSRVTAFLQAVR
jgi:phospholipase C